MSGKSGFYRPLFHTGLYMEKYIVDNENNVNNDLSFISSKSAEFQEVFLNKRESKQQPLEEKFSRLEKNVNILFENFVYSQENSKINQEKNEEILQIRKIFCELEDLNRLVLWSYVVDGQSINAIARQLGIGWHRVAYMIEHSLNRFRQHLS